MANERIVLDTGPLVALLADDDAEHSRCVEESRLLPKPLLTTWPVLTEAAWLLRHQPGFLGLLQQGLILCVELDLAAISAIDQLAKKYSDIGPQLADLTLVYLAERENTSTVFALDRRDFSIYRDKAGDPFRLLPS